MERDGMIRKLEESAADMEALQKKVVAHGEKGLLKKFFVSKAIAKNEKLLEELEELQD